MISACLLGFVIGASSCRTPTELVHAARRGDSVSRQLLGNAFVGGSRCAYELGIEQLGVAEDAWALPFLQQTVLAAERPWQEGAFAAVVRIAGGIELARRVFAMGPQSKAWRSAMWVLAEAGVEEAIQAREVTRAHECSVALAAGRLGIGWVEEEFVQDIGSRARGGRPVVSFVCAEGRVAQTQLKSGDVIVGVNHLYCASLNECWNLLAEVSARREAFELTIADSQRRLRVLRVPGTAK